MKATKEQIIETALQILERYEPLNIDSIRINEKKVFVPSGTGNNDYYKHAGWSFMVNGTEFYKCFDGYEYFPDTYSLSFLEDGTCIYFALNPGEGGSGIRSYMIFEEGVGYQWASTEKFLAHYKFDFNDPKFEKFIWKN